MSKPTFLCSNSSSLCCGQLLWTVLFASHHPGQLRIPFASDTCVAANWFGAASGNAHRRTRRRDARIQSPHFVLTQTAAHNLQPRSQPHLGLTHTLPAHLAFDPQKAAELQYSLCRRGQVQHHFHPPRHPKRPPAQPPAFLLAGPLPGPAPTRSRLFAKRSCPSQQPC